MFVVPWLRASSNARWGRNGIEGGAEKLYARGCEAVRMEQKYGRGHTNTWVWYWLWKRRSPRLKMPVNDGKVAPVLYEEDSGCGKRRRNNDDEV